MTDMTRAEAEKVDNGSRYVDFDEETQMWGVFGTESGFCYFIAADMAAAQLEEEIFKRNEEKVENFNASVLRQKTNKAIEDQATIYGCEIYGQFSDFVKEAERLAELGDNFIYIDNLFEDNRIKIMSMGFNVEHWGFSRHSRCYRISW